MTAHVMYRQDPSGLFDGADEGYLAENPTPVWSCWGPDYDSPAIMDDFGTAIPVVYADEAPAFGGMLIAVRRSTPTPTNLTGDNPMRLFILDEAGTYRAAAPAEIVSAAKTAITTLYKPGRKIDGDCAAKDLFFIRLAERDQEVFAVLFLDNKHRVIQYEELFFGTIDSSAVHPRQVVKRALHHNAAAVILGHNHPSGELEPSRADENITARLKDALALVDVRTLDHIIVGKSGAMSFAERGLI